MESVIVPEFITAPQISYQVTYQGVVETRIIEPKAASKQFVLKAMADFLMSSIADIKQARKDTHTLTIFKDRQPRGDRKASS